MSLDFVYARSLSLCETWSFLRLRLFCRALIEGFTSRLLFGLLTYNASEKDHEVVREEARDLMRQIQEKGVEYDPDRKVCFVSYLSCFPSLQHPHSLFPLRSFFPFSHMHFLLCNLRT